MRPRRPQRAERRIDRPRTPRAAAASALCAQASRAPCAQANEPRLSTCGAALTRSCSMSTPLACGSGGAGASGLWSEALMADRGRRRPRLRRADQATTRTGDGSRIACAASAAFAACTMGVDRCFAASKPGSATRGHDRLRCKVDLALEQPCLPKRAGRRDDDGAGVWTPCCLQAAPRQGHPLAHGGDRRVLGEGPPSHRRTHAFMVQHVDAQPAHDMRLDGIASVTPHLTDFCVSWRSGGRPRFEVSPMIGARRDR